MTNKKIELLKFASLIGLLIIVISITAIGSMKDSKGFPEINATAIKDTLIIPTETKISLRDSIVNYGMHLLGTPYVYGACRTDGFDCSGFVYYVFNHFKIYTPRSSSQYNNFGKEISIDSVKKGDILVFLSPTRNVVGHVGIVTNPNGMESDFIHASSGSQMKVIISSLKQEGYKRRFVKALDVL